MCYLIYLLVLSSIYCILGSPIAQDCNRVIVNERGRRSLVGGYRDHISVGLGRECFESISDLHVEENSVRCFKWRLRNSGNVQLNDREREVPTKNLTVSTCNSVTFRSPGFYNSNKKHYSNNMFCVYNISMQDCNHITVRSTSSEHSLFDDGRDYLYFDFGQVTTTVTGDSVSSFSESVPTSSFYAVLWSDAEKYTSAGKFEFEAMCNDPVGNSAVTENESSGSGYHQHT